MVFTLLLYSSLSDHLHLLCIALQHGNSRVHHLRTFLIGPMYFPQCLVCVVSVAALCPGSLWVSVMLWVQEQHSALSWMSSPLRLPGVSTANLCLRRGCRVNMVFYQQESDSPQLSTSISFNHAQHTQTHTGQPPRRTHTAPRTQTRRVWLLIKP